MRTPSEAGRPWTPWGLWSARTRTGELVVVPAVADGRNDVVRLDRMPSTSNCAVWLPQHRYLNSCMGALPSQHPENDDVRFLRAPDGVVTIDDRRHTSASPALSRPGIPRSRGVTRAGRQPSPRTNPQRATAAPTAPDGPDDSTVWPRGPPDGTGPS